MGAAMIHGRAMNAPTRSKRQAPGTAREPAPAVPGWLRRGASVGAEADVAVIAGAALVALDALVRRNEPWAGLWRQRLALKAAAATARQARRTEDEAALRDTLLLTRPGDSVGPAGRLLLAWRRLASEQPQKLIGQAGLAELASDLDLAPGDGAISDLAVRLDTLGSGSGLVESLLGTVDTAQAHGFGRPGGALLADAMLAHRLGWSRAVPLLGTELKRAGETLPSLSRAALNAIDLSAELGRRAQRLLEVSPRLRAKASDKVVERLLADDALVSSTDIPGISDRGLRRLFDRLIELEAVRELTGRTTFRIYGL